MQRFLATRRVTATRVRPWLSHRHDAQPDYAPPWLLNRFDWYEAHAWRVPYPGDPRIYAPADVPPPTTFLGATGVARTNAEMGFYARRAPQRP